MLAFVSIFVGQIVLAAPFCYEFTSTISGITGSPDPSVNVGDNVRIVVVLDNGGTTNQSQTWTTANLQAVIFDFGDGTLRTTFSAPFGGGLLNEFGSFVTDAAGNPTTVMSNWSDDSVGTDVATNSNNIPNRWFINSFNGIYYEDDNEIEIAINDVAGNIVASNWSAAACPPPASPSSVGGFAEPLLPVNE